MYTTRLLSALLGTLCIAGPALANDFDAIQAEPNGKPPAPGEVRREIRQVIDIRDGNGAPMGPMRMGGKVVKNLPYSAEMITERVQNLADGNQIVNKHTAISYRDSAGRTRQEMRDDKGEVRTVTIHDPVAGLTTILNPRTRTATQISPPKFGPGPGAIGEAARARVEQLRKEGKLPQERNEIVIRRSEDDGDNVNIATEPNGAIKVTAKEMHFAGGNPRELQLGPLAGAFSDMQWAGKATTRDLGVREIDGLRAEGKSRSYEIPAGAMGNRNAIVVSDESWYAPDLQITVLTRHIDPRSGENNFRLTSIKREEPAASLFAVPSDYTIKDPLAKVRTMIEKRSDTPAR